MIHPHRHTVPIFDADCYRPDLIGSAVYIIVDGIRLLLTAAHVFEPRVRRRHEPPTYAYRIGTGFPGSEFFDFVSYHRDDPRNLDAEVGIKIFAMDHNPEKGLADEYKDGLDLALVELPDHMFDKLDEYYSPYDLRSAESIRPTDSAVVCGWPWKRNIYHRTKQAANFKCWEHVPMQVLPADEIRQMEGGDPGAHIPLHFDRKKGYADSTTKRRKMLPKLNCVSGGGVWYTSCHNTDENPTEVLGLAGIFIRTNEEKKMAMAVRGEHAWIPLTLGFHCERHPV